jgi:SAM-dependent methyltransferase
MIELARKHNRLLERCEYFLNENNSLALFESASFDLVYSSLVLQHMRPELAKGYIREFARVLAPGGVLVFQLPAARELDPLLLPPPDQGSFRARHPSLHYLLSRLGVVALYRRVRPATPAPSRGSAPGSSAFQPVMEMNCVPRAEVERDLEVGGLRVVKADAHALPGFTSYFYWAQKPR